MHHLKASQDITPASKLLQNINPESAKLQAIQNTYQNTVVTANSQKYIETTCRQVSKEESASTSNLALSDSVKTSPD